MFNRHHHCGARGGGRGWRPFAGGWETDVAGLHGMGPGRGRRGRMFDGSELRLVLLKLIADQPRHGYDLIREIEELTGGAYAPSPGVVYPTITLLDDMGLIEEQKTEGAKKLFATTEAGRQHLAERAEEVAALFARLTELGSARRRADSASVKRAMGNLGLVLMHRFGRGDVDTDTLHRIVSIIDEAAQKIERLD